jgi:hypothetical protein
MFSKRSAAVFWSGSAVPSRATEVNERIELGRTLKSERRDHRLSVSNDRLQLSYVKLGVWGLFILHV